MQELDDAVDESRDGPRPNTYGFQHSDPSDTGRYVDMQGVNWPNYEARENHVVSLSSLFAGRFLTESPQVAPKKIDQGPVNVIATEICQTTFLYFQRFKPGKRLHMKLSNVLQIHHYYLIYSNCHHDLKWYIHYIFSAVVGVLWLPVNNMLWM